MKAQALGSTPGPYRPAKRLVAAIGLVWAICGVNVTMASARHSVEMHQCLHGLQGLTWTVTSRHRGYDEITAIEPRAAQVYRGTIRALPRSAYHFIDVSTWGQARVKIGDIHVYAMTYWPHLRPVSAVIFHSPAAPPGIPITVPCQW